MLKEFKEFIMTGNVIDLAVAVILAGAIGLVINSFVADIAMPIVGYLAGGVDFSDKKIILAEAVMNPDGTIAAAENAIRYGKWITSFINLILVGFVLFIMVKAYNKTKKKEEEPAPAGPTQEQLLTEIRDLLAK